MDHETTEEEEATHNHEGHELGETSSNGILEIEIELLSLRWNEEVFVELDHEVLVAEGLDCTEVSDGVTSQHLCIFICILRILH